MNTYRVRFVSSLSTGANEEWVTSPELNKGDLATWVSNKGNELGKVALETQPV